MNYQETKFQHLLIDPRESLELEIKGWLNLTESENVTKLIKAIIALGNHGGGRILVGYSSIDEMNFTPDNQASHLEQYTTDTINNLIDKYIEPPFHCELLLLQHPSLKQKFPLIIVPGGTVPMHSNKGGYNQELRGKYFIRRTGPKSEPPQTAYEWDQLISRCVRQNKEELLDDFRKIIEVGNAPSNQSLTNNTFSNWVEKCKSKWQEKNNSLQDNDPAKLKVGKWLIAYELKNAKALLSLNELKLKLQNVQIPVSWPAFYVPTSKEIEPIANNEGLECWFGTESSRSPFRGPDDSDYWIYTKDGKAFLASGFREDGSDFLQNEKHFILNTPILKLANCLLHAQKMATLFGCPDTQIEFKFSWEGLEGRTLVYWKDNSRLAVIEGQPVCSINDFLSEFKVVASDIGNLLPEIIYNQLFPLYENFNLFRLPKDFVISEVAKIRKGLC